MNRQIIIIALSAMALSAMALSTLAQDPGSTQEVSRSWSSNQVERQTNRFGSRGEKRSATRKHDQMDQKRKDRRLKLMERELKRIGVTDEEKALITELQKQYKKKMMANAQRTAKAREKLSTQLDEGASMEVLEGAIQDVAAAQAEQLRILVLNRIEMERILGKKKNDEFMKNARMQFQKQGHRGGPPLPPRPGLPPTPGQESGPPKPDIPPASGN